MGLLQRLASLAYPNQRYEITKYNPDEPDLAIFEYDTRLGCPDCGSKNWTRVRPVGDRICGDCYHWFLELKRNWLQRIYYHDLLTAIV